MNQINLGGASGISGLMTSVTRSYASPSIQELLAEPATKRKSKKDEETYRSISSMGEHKIEKQSSIQVTQLEVLSEEGIDDRTIRRVDGQQHLLHSPSEKRYREEAESLSARRYSPGLKGKLLKGNNQLNQDSS